MSYADLTHADPNPIKRWLQNRRLAKAVALTPSGARRVLDYGAGDGEAAVRLAHGRPELEIVCFEPAPELHAQAVRRTASLHRIRLAASEAELQTDWADTVLCLEVFEHLPGPETEVALLTIARVLRPGGLLIVGVPQEVGPVAAAKGVFRRSRRSRAFDAGTAGIMGAAVGRPPLNRPLAEIAPGRRYHPHHLGFDHRPLMRALEERFRVEATTGTPFGRVLPSMNSELYITAVNSEVAP